MVTAWPTRLTVYVTLGCRVLKGVSSAFRVLESKVQRPLTGFKAASIFSKSHFTWRVCVCEVRDVRLETRMGHAADPNSLSPRTVC